MYCWITLGELPATMVDFGQWDHEDHYDGTYENANEWGEQRWSTPGVVVDGKGEAIPEAQVTAFPDMRGARGARQAARYEGLLDRTGLYQPYQPKQDDPRLPALIASMNGPAK